MSYTSVPALGQDWLTPFFDALLAVVGLGEPLTERVIERANIQEGEHVLDVGCGTATLLIPPACFDVVTSTLVFHHLPTEIKQRAVQERGKR